MDLQFTAVFRKVPEGYIGFVEELPGANTQGATLEEARANLQEAVALVLEANRTLARGRTATRRLTFALSRGCHGHDHNTRTRRLQRAVGPRSVRYPGGHQSTSTSKRFRISPTA
jgi:predicted RNase H-like HicB family nuclease